MTLQGTGWTKLASHPGWLPRTQPSCGTATCPGCSQEGKEVQLLTTDKILDIVSIFLPISEWLPENSKGTQSIANISVER